MKVQAVHLCLLARVVWGSDACGSESDVTASSASDSHFTHARHHNRHGLPKVPGCGMLTRCEGHAPAGIANAHHCQKQPLTMQRSCVLQASACCAARARRATRRRCWRAPTRPAWPSRSCRARCAAGSCARPTSTPPPGATWPRGAPACPRGGFGLADPGTMWCHVPAPCRVQAGAVCRPAVA